MDRVDIDVVTDEAEPEGAGRFRRKRTMAVIAVIVAVMAALSCTAGWILNNHDTDLSGRSRGDGILPQELLGETDDIQAAETGTDTTESETESAAGPPADPEELGYAAPHKITETVRLADVYAVPGSEVKLECFYPEAESYAWEVYDRHKCTWEPMDGVILQDELYRPVSVLSVLSGGTDTTSVRCSVQMENGETVTESASVYIITGDILDISIKEDYVTDAGRYVSSREIPVCVSYADGTQDTITGLYQTAFVESTENREVSASSTGNSVETVTTVYTECGYAYVGLEDKDLLLRYRGGDGQAIDTGVTISGKDLSAPVISEVSVSGYEITNVDAPVTASISITAEDDKTPYPDLEYAFIPKDPENETVPKEEDWNHSAAFDINITQNGTWVAFCRDRGGNAASMEKEIIVVDQKAPVISVCLLSTEWCSSNQIIADAEDYLPVEYRFLSEDGEDSGWTTKNRQDVSGNGTWEVQARDSAGNISSESITVSNIDKQSPVIKMITVEKAAGTEQGTGTEGDKETEGEAEGDRDED